MHRWNGIDLVEQLRDDIRSHVAGSIGSTARCVDNQWTFADVFNLSVKIQAILKCHRSVIPVEYIALNPSLPTLPHLALVVKFTEMAMFVFRRHFTSDHFYEMGVITSV